MPADQLVSPAPAAPFAAAEPSRWRLIAGALLLAVVAIGGLYAVKWSPYLAKAFVAAARHTLGPSIVSGRAAAPPAPGIAAALLYARAYFLAIWQALVLGLVVGATLNVFFPRRWVFAALGRVGARSAAVGGTLSLAGMMCTCCTAPVVLALRAQRASLGAAMAFFLGNPVLNPATLIFIGLVLSWPFALLRLGVGVALVIVVAWYANRSDVLLRDRLAAPEPSPIEQPQRGARALAFAWFGFLWWEIRTIVPAYVALVLVLGFARAWLFAPAVTLGNGSVVALVVLAVAGTLFVIPTAGEVPIVQTLMGLGMGVVPAAVLLLTLPSISLPSAVMVRRAFPRRVLLFALGAVAVSGLVAGAAARLVLAR